MNIDQILASPEKAFEFGRDCSGEEWKLYREKIIWKVFKDPQWCLEAVCDWPEQRFSFRIGDRATSSPNLSYEAAQRFPDFAFRTYKNIIIEEVAKDPELSCKAGHEWPADRFGDRLVETVVQSSEWSYEAGKRWSDKLFEKHKEQLVEGVTQSPEWSYKAGKNWRLVRGYDAQEKLAAAVATDPEMSLYAAQYWEGGLGTGFGETFFRSIIRDPEQCFWAGYDGSFIKAGYIKGHFIRPYKPGIIAGVKKSRVWLDRAVLAWSKEYVTDDLLAAATPGIQEYSHQVDERYRETWDSFVLRIEPAQLVTLPHDDFYFVARAYDLLLGVDVKNEEAFWNGFRDVLQIGDIREWAQHLIDTYTDDAIGGENYRKSCMIILSQHETHDQPLLTTQDVYAPYQ